MTMIHSAPEPLEARIAPATLINPTTVTFHDLDRDDVTVKFSKPVLGSAATANAVLKFNAGTIDADPANDTPQQLQLIDLTALPADVAAGLGITVTAKRNATRGGDGFGDVGFINANGIDLGRIVAGLPDATDTSAVKSLTVQSMGELGVSTQAAAGTLVSIFNGPL